MMSLFPILSLCSIVLVGAALSDDSGFDWGDPDEDYESPFADEVDDDSGDAPEEPTENPFASASDDDSEESEPEESESEGSEEKLGEGVEPIGADPLTTIAEARSLCTEAMKALYDGDADQAFDQLGAHWAFAADEMTQLQSEVERTRAVVGDRYGDALDYRLVREDTVDEVLVRFVYLERFERHGLQWQFTFYEGGDGWTLNDVSFDDDIESLLD